MNYPTQRPRRLRKNQLLRDMVAETLISPDKLVYPVFVKEMEEREVPVDSMPGISQYSPEGILYEIEDALNSAVRAILIFGIPQKKDETGSGAYDKKGIVQRTVRDIKKRFGSDMLVITDVCMCEYTSHGHCGIVKDGYVDNDESVKLLARSALSHVLAGADMVAPSDMMDGRIQAVREVLDLHGDYSVPIMAYSAKYASCLYGPFREAAESAPESGDRKSYQMDPPNAREAMREIELDIREGADIIMVKPALFYLDILATARARFDVPLAAYSVSGEYAMIKLAAQQGWLDHKRAVIESTTAIRRAGADIIITYFAKDLCTWAKEHSL